MKHQRKKDIFPNNSIARYNLAVWQKHDEDTLSFIGREVASAGINGEPDNGVLKLFEVNPDGSIKQERVIWKPIYDGINLEDPRALELPNGNLLIGLTAVLRKKDGNPIAFPAIVKIDAFKSWSNMLPPFLIVDSFGPGKNLTPIDNSTYLFRPDATEYRHKILAFSLHAQIPVKLDDLVFPTDLPWALWKVGTTMPPIWLTPNEALFIIHGITIEQIDGKEKYIYSIGRAKLTRNGDCFRVTVARDPILTPDDFLDTEGKPLVAELHPELRRVIYSCGGILKEDNKDTLSLYVNVGDRKTFEVDFSLQDLKEDLF